MDNARGNAIMVSNACKRLQRKENKKRRCSWEAVKVINFSLPHLELTTG